MSFESKHIQIGSGSLYCVPWPSAGTFPAEATMKTEANRLGHIKGGATLTYTPNYYKVEDDLQLVSKSRLVAADVTFNTGVITWNAELLSKLAEAATFEHEDATTTAEGYDLTKIGGNGNWSEKLYAILFVSADETKKIRMKAQSIGEFALAFNPDSETNLPLSFTCLPMDSDGTRAEYEEVIPKIVTP